MTKPKATIVEVGPRDGFQIETTFIPTEAKIEIVDGLIDAGLRHFEVTSFVSPKAIPQMRDAAAVVNGVKRVEGRFLTALVPNPKGAELAAKTDLDALVVFVSASESHNKANVNRTVEESLTGFETVAAIAAQAGKVLQGAIATSFGCPFEGDVAPEAVGRVAERMKALGINKISLGDTTGMATPPVVRRTLSYLREKFPDMAFTPHFHNTRGVGLVNVYEAWNLGFAKFESSIAGLGGCPFAPGASGNVTTEDMVYLFHEMGVETGIDLEALLKVAQRAEEIIGRTLPGQVMKSGPRLKKYPMPNSGKQERLAAPTAGNCPVN